MSAFVCYIGFLFGFLAILYFGFLIFTSSKDPKFFDQVKGWAQLMSPVIALSAVAVAAYVAYQTWLLPFQPVFIVGPGYQTILSKSSINVYLPITLRNEGAVSGSAELAVRIRFRKGDWILEPQFLANNKDVTAMMFGKETTLPPFDGAFATPYVAPRSHAVFTVLFNALPKDFDPSFIDDSEQYPIELLARQRPGIYEVVWTAKMVIAKEDAALLKKGEVIKAQQITSDKPTRDLMPD